MYQPQLESTSRERSVITAFGGYDHRPSASENTFFETENMTSSSYPFLSVRNRRAAFNVESSDLQCLFSKEKVGFIKNGILYYGGIAWNGHTFPDISTERKVVSFGSKLIVFPDKYYVNMKDMNDHGYLYASFESQNGVNVTFSLSRSDGTLYENYTVSSTEPSDAQNGDLWLDTSVEPNMLRQFSEYGASWVDIYSTYVRISTPGIGSAFSQYDGVTVSGAANDGMNGSFVIRSKTADSITVDGLISTVLHQTTPLKVERAVPDMDFVCESANRLWGCSSEKNEIYASKLGDPTNFNCFMGISTDSYAVSIGTDGEFTGAAPFRNQILFFKENCVHKVFGVNPPFSVSFANIRGVQKGSHRSLATVNETLYYKSPTGICAYDGGIPICVSDELGGVYYKNACAGVSGSRYYVCMRTKNDEAALFVYDEDNRIWEKEDDSDITEFVCHNYNLYCIRRDGNSKKLCLCDGENIYGNLGGILDSPQAEGDFKWSLQTGLWGLSLPNNKYYSDIILRCIGEKGAKMNVYFRFDSSGEWVKKAHFAVEKTGSFGIPVELKRCDHLEMKIEGNGRIRILSISRVTEEGSELNG